MSSCTKLVNSIAPRKKTGQGAHALVIRRPFAYGRSYEGSSYSLLITLGTDFVCIMKISSI